MRRTKQSLVAAGLAALCLAGPGCRSTKPEIYAVEEKGSTTWRAVFDKKMPDSARQWAYALETRNAGRLKKAERRMLYLTRRWPNSREAPWAARAYADILYERGKPRDAFKAYQSLIDNYSSRMTDYGSALQRQFDIAVEVMETRRLRWLFGGYRAPEYAVELFEDIIRNGPQWERAPEAQFLVGKCNQEAGELELAIVAYGVLGYRYPDSDLSEEAAWQRIACLDKLRQRYPASGELLDRTLTATTVFLSTFPDSKRKVPIIELRNRIYEIKAGKVFDQAAFYAKVPKEAGAAILYYEKLIEEYPRSKRVPEAEERIAQLRKLMAMPEAAQAPLAPRSKPLFGKDDPDARG